MAAAFDPPLLAGSIFALMDETDRRFVNVIVTA